jgi:nitrogen fixation/metabolism regulation signal transduction histidine kinase
LEENRNHNESVEIKAQLSRLKVLFANAQNLTNNLKWHYQKLGAQAMSANMQGVVSSVNSGQLLLEALSRSTETVNESDVVVNIVPILKDIIESFQLPDMTCYYDFQQHDLSIYGRYTDIYYVFYSIIQNAMEATESIPEKSVLNVSARYRNGKVVVAISNNGPAIQSKQKGDKDSIRHIFNAGFSTKGKAGNSLSEVLRIMSNHSGNIRVLNKPHDVVFKLIFPANRR